MTTLANSPRGHGWQQAGWLVLYVAVVGAPVAVVAWQDRLGDADWGSRLGRYTALAAFGVLVLQFVLAARVTWIERPFGLDRIFRFHKLMGLVAGLLLLAHPLFLAWSRGDLTLLTSLHPGWQVWIGKAAALVLVALVAGALGRRLLHLEFQRWLKTHNRAAILVLALAATHGLYIESDISEGVLLLWYTRALVAVAALAWLWGTALRPLLARRRVWTVTRVTAATPNVWTLELAPPVGQPVFAYLPGQFAFLTLRRGPGLPVEEHPFTIASSPTQAGTLAFSIKESGDFTKTIGQTKPGDQATVSGPCGAFSFRRFAAADRRPLVLIAGGIGITPFLSTLRYLRDTGFDRDVQLVWGNRAERDLACRAELDELVAAAGGKLKIVHVLSEPDAAWAGARGKADRELLARVCAPPAGRVYAVCGPPPMMRSVRASLRALGVPRRDLHAEFFAL